jgi:hypothetical protein
VLFQLLDFVPEGVLLINRRLVVAGFRTMDPGARRSALEAGRNIVGGREEVGGERRNGKTSVLSEGSETWTSDEVN